MQAFKKLAASVTVPIVLLFTKKDVFVEHLKTQPFSNFFPEYMGPMDSSNICANFAMMFRRLDNKPGRRFDIYFLNATDPGNFKEVYREIASNLFQQPRGAAEHQTSPSKYWELDKYITKQLPWPERQRQLNLLSL